ncbi:MAG: hypothetical protein AAGA65_18965 [Actinomycetota bacterium]
MADKIPPRFRKTKTEKWAVMAPVEDLEKALAEGGKIDVQKKSGDWSSFVVASLGKPFDIDGVQMCYGYGPEEAGADQGGGSGGGRQAAGAQANGGRDRAGPSGPNSDPWLARERELPQHRDNSEPIPEYQGGPEDEWQEF